MPSIGPEALTVIQERLDAIERAEKVRILYACESGSRAWGFPSPDSDYDVRFIYARPRDWYFSLDVELKRDVIELPIVDDYDINGWDVRKAMQLLWKSNPALHEWLRSPIVYRERPAAGSALRALADRYYASRASAHHYYSMASNQMRTNLTEGQIRLKRYLYALRPLFAIRWIEQDRGPVPIEFHKLIAVIDDPKLIADIRDLLERKARTSELGSGPKISSLSDFIEHEIGRINPEALPTHEPQGSFEQLDAAFRHIVELAWQPEAMTSPLPSHTTPV